MTSQQLTTKDPPMKTCSLTDRMKVMISLFAILALSSLKQGSAHIADVIPGFRQENVAIRGKATQSAVYNHADEKGYSQASNAIDGNKDSNFLHGSCSHTTNTTNPWWRVDLLQQYRIASVTITNRGDCCADSIRGARILIGDSLMNNGINNPQCDSIGCMTPGETRTFHCRHIMKGRYVTVYLPRKEAIHICEVEVNALFPVKS